MKTRGIFLWLFVAGFPHFLFAQILSLNSGSTYAVVVGISDYQDENIPDLRFADKDAEAFAKYLQSPAGGSLPYENIKLLTNEKATMAAMAAQLDWLLEVSKEGDKAIIYYSGHGDVEAKTATQPGFLLTYDSPPKIYIAGAYPLFYLQLIVQTLSTDKNVQTLIITDACRAGKLAGSEIGGTQATAANLAKQYANEIKILSCQPDEFSLEGEQWGSGRGAFSYHLIEGLIGLADKNQDGRVNLLEIENYLEDIVPVETNPQIQIPLTIGSKGTLIANVNDAVLAELKNLKEQQLPTMAAIESKGFEETLLANADSSVQKKYEDFITALEDDNLLVAQKGKPSADDLYRELMKEESLTSLHRFMTRQFTIALQDDAQQAVNAYLLANPTELQKRWKGDTTYSQYPRYLGRAAELLGESHYMHDYLIAKQLYFEGLNLRLQLDQGETSHSYEEAIEKQEAAVALESRAAYFYNELGVLHTRLKLSEKAVRYYKKAIELAPGWGLPYVNLCLEYFYNDDQEKAIETGDKAIELMPDYPQLYNLLGWVNANYLGNFDRRNWKRQGVELREDFRYNFNNTSSRTQLKQKFQKTIDLLKKAIEIDSNFAAAHANIGPVYQQMGQHAKAEFHLKKATQLDPSYAFAFSMLGIVYNFQKKCSEAEVALQKAIELRLQENPGTAALSYNSLGNVYKSCFRDNDKALNAYQKAVELAPFYGFPWGGMASIYASRKDFQKAEWHYLKYREVDSDNSTAYAGNGRFYQSINRYEEAEWMFLKAIEKLPDYVYGINELVKLYQKKGDRKATLEWQEKLLELAPEDSWVYSNAGRLAYESKQYKQAEIYFQKAVDLDSTNWSTLNNIGVFYRRHSENKEAKEHLIKARQLNPPSRYPYTNLSFVLYDAGADQEGNAWLDTVWVKFQDPMAFYFKMCFKLYREHYKEAKEQLHQLISHRKSYSGLTDVFHALENKHYSRVDSLVNAMPDSLNNLSNYFLARVQAQLGLGEKAVELLRKDINLFPYGMIVRDTFFSSLHGRQDFEQLLREYFPEKFDDLDTFMFTKKEALYYPDNCVLLAKYYESEGEFERARVLYQKAVSLHVDSLTNDIAIALAEAYLGLGRFEEAHTFCPDSVSRSFWKEYCDDAITLHRVKKTGKAEALVQKAVALDTAEAYFPYGYMGWFYTDHSDYERSEKYCYQSIEKNRNFTLSYVHLATLYQSFGQMEKMMAILEKGLASNPNDKKLRELEVILGYFAYPPEVAKLKFEEAAKSEPAFQLIWEYLEQIRKKEFSKAILTWEEFGGTWGWNKGKIETTNIAYTYLAALLQSGDMERAIDILGQMQPIALPYQLLTTYPLLEPLRKEQAYQDYLLRHFPERVLY